MNVFIVFCIFMVVLFLYVHINNQLNKSEDLEVYEMDYKSNEDLQSICNVKQPILFELKLPDLLDTISTITKHETVDIKVWNTSEYIVGKSNSYILIPLSSASGLFKTDTKSQYITDRNQDFLEETDMISDIKEIDQFLKPRFTVYSNYEYIFGSEGVVSPLRYHTGDRKFIYVTSGKISVKMTPWRSKKYLDPISDYETYDFFSRFNPWIDSNPMMKLLEFEVLAGYVLYIPPYWWYSYKLTSVDTSAIGVEYKTPINLCAHSSEIVRYYLQFHNTKNIPVRSLNLDTSI